MALKVIAIRRVLTQKWINWKKADNCESVSCLKRHEILICFSNCFTSSANSEITKSKTETIETVIEKEFYCFSQKSYCLQLWLISGFDFVDIVKIRVENQIVIR
jgi:hypothetical protein